MTTSDLVNRARAILRSHLQPAGLNDQQALVEMHALFDLVQMQHGDVVSVVTQAAEAMRRHKQHLLNDQQAIDEIYSILNREEDPLLRVCMVATSENYLEL
jgi:hypothetical protein